MSTVDKYIETERVADPAPGGGLVSLDQVQPHEPDFLWRPYLRRGNLNLLRGNGGSGKTTLCFALTAALTLGEQPPGMPGTLCVERPRAVLYLGGEDDMPEYRAALDRQGARAELVFMSAGQIPNIGDTDRIRAMIADCDAALLIIDPVQALLPPGVDMNKANEVRPILDGLRAVCRETGCTGLVIEHLNKATKSANTYRGSGSMDFFNAARSVLITGWTEQGKHACGHLKSNGAAYGPAILYDIGPDGRLVWRGGDGAVSGEDVQTTRPQLALALPEIGSPEDREKYEASDVARAMRAFCGQVQDGDEQRVSYRDFNDWCVERGFRVVGGAQLIHKEIDRYASRLLEYDRISVAFDKRVGSGKGMWVTRRRAAS